MGYDATIRALREKANFYATAANALMKVAVAEGQSIDAEPAKRGRPRGKARKPLSAATRAAMAAGQQRRHALRRAAEAAANGDVPPTPDPSSVQ